MGWESENFGFYQHEDKEVAMNYEKNPAIFFLNRTHR